MKILVDTHALLWMLEGNPKLSKRARQILSSDANELLFSLVSLWEIAVKMQIGKLPGFGSSVAYIRDELAEHNIAVLPIRYEHILAMHGLPMHHTEPFDRLILAQAVVESLPILTHDRMFPAYPVKLVW